MLSLSLVSILSANPIYRLEELDSTSAKHYKTLHGMESQLTSNTNGKLCSSSDRLCKLHRRNQDFYIWRARPLELILPLHHSAPVLREFYYAILTQVNEQWLLQAPLPNFWIKQGNLELFFTSEGGPIPWSVVARFAYKMLCATQLGWVGTYEIIYQNGAADRAVGVTLQIANNEPSSAQQDLIKARAAGEAKRTGLKKRGAVQLTSFKIHGGIVPFSAATPYVKAFFDAIAVEASTAWTSRPETASFTVAQGSLKLTVSCLGAKIPWPMLVSAAQKFSALADDFWANTIDAYYEKSELAITIASSLHLLQTAATAQDSLTTSPPTRRNLQRQTPPPTTSTPIRARTIPPTPKSPGIKVATFIQTAALVPSALAAAKLEDFYTIIALKIETGQLAHRLPSKTVVCALWDFELTFSSDSINVPLSFVQAFAIDMAEWSSRQFTGFYEATVLGEGPLAGLVVLVQMKLKDKGSRSPYLM